MRKLMKNSITGIANIIRKPLRIRVGGSAPHVLSLENDDAGGNGVFLDFYRDSASPAASDGLGYIAIYGRDSAANKENYGVFGHQILDPANGSEDSKWVIESKVGGVLTRSMNFSAGVWTESATGGDPGAGKINATEFQTNGVALPFSKEFVSSQIAIVAAADAAVTHGLGVRPKLIAVELVCITGEAGYAAGDRLYIPAFSHSGGTAGTLSFAMAVLSGNTTEVYYTIYSGASAATVPNKTSGAAVSITNANWEFVIKAWA